VLGVLAPSTVAVVAAVRLAATLTTAIPSRQG
jgi:hypothetical protein